MNLVQYLKNVYTNRLAILEGIYNVLFAKRHIKVIAKKRQAICAVCPYNSANSKEKSNIPYTHCTICGCSLKIKPYVMEAECPKKFWLSRKID